MKRINILFTGIGRRIELIQAFRQAAMILGVDLKIYGADMAGTAPALVFCDYIEKVCSMKDPDYISQLLQICKNNNIQLLIPTIDTDLLVLSEHISEFEEIGTKVLISKPDKIKICRDKNYTAEFFEKCGLKAPRTYNDYKKYTGKFPAFIKPKDGSSSINAFKVNNAEELEVYAEKIGDYIIQPFIEGKEYTIDIFCDFDNNPITIIPRERIQVRSGEVLKTKITMDENMIKESRQLIEKFCPAGPITVQLIREKETGIDYYIEINPRFGGGAPLSMKAGARSAEVILKLLNNEKVYFHQDDIDDGAVYSRFDQSVCIECSKHRSDVKGVIFDLDDTLYSEKEYVRSGFRAISEYLGDVLAEEKLLKYFENGLPAIDEYLKETNQIDRKSEILEIYREHEPDIHLYNGVQQLIIQLKSKGIKIGIITDGRVSGQKKKIAKLGLDKLVDDIIITDELGGIQFRKPCDIAFRIMQNRWRVNFEQIVYIGDNPDKDFQAPKQLGMMTIYYNNSESIKKSLIKSNFKAQFNIYSITDLLK